MEEQAPDVLTGQPCPFCSTKNLTLTEMKKDIPYFGEFFLFSMTCSNCKYHKADIEAAEKHDPVKYTFEINGEEDLKVRVVKSASATVKIPHMISMEPGEASSGYVSNVEGVLNRFKKILEQARDESEEQSDRKKAKNMLKKLTNALWGKEKLKLIIEDPTGNSAIISEKAVKDKLKAKKN